jgi:hypothetical protein
MGAELFHAAGQTDGHNEANSSFSQFVRAPKKLYFPKLYYFEHIT